MRILCVDDEENIRMLYKEELEEDGYFVDTADNGVEALRMIEESVIFDKPYNLIMLDIRMCYLDGIQTLYRIKKQWNKLLVVLNTAYGEYKQDFSTWGSDAYVVKNADLSELKNTIKNLIEMQLKGQI